MLKLIPKILLFGLFLCFISCKNQDTSFDFVPDKRMDRSVFDTINSKNIFFGHMSVGGKTILGIKRLIEFYNYPSLNLYKTDHFNELDTTFFAHQNLGRNGNPKSKIDEFIKLVKSDTTGLIDIAFFKFCYADIKVETDVEDVFSYYTQKMDILIADNPDIDFFHITVPLKSKPSGFKGIVKYILNYDHNINRMRYNELLRDYYKTADIFDIALYESTYPYGKREVYRKNRYGLVPAYTYDGGHFNEYGSLIIAEKFLLYLSNRISSFSETTPTK